MDWAKLDAGLIAALGPGAGALSTGRAAGGRSSGGERGRAVRGERTLSVFVHVDAAGADADPERRDRLGVGPPGEEIRTATLSPAEVAELSDVPWVTWLALAGHLRLLDDDQG